MEINKNDVLEQYNVVKDKLIEILKIPNFIGGCGPGSFDYLILYDDRIECHSYVNGDGVEFNAEFDNFTATWEEIIKPIEYFIDKNRKELMDLAINSLGEEATPYLTIDNDNKVHYERDDSNFVVC